jgi:hypothetical protein
MIESRNRSVDVQTLLVATQHIQESEATDGKMVAAVRIPANALILGGALSAAEAFSAGTLGLTFRDLDDADTVLLAPTSVAAELAPTPLTGAPLHTSLGGWVYFVCAGSDPAAQGGDALATIQYVVDGRGGEVMPEDALAPADV